MLLQALIVAAIVSACTVYAGWSLLPAVLKQRVAVALLARRPSGPGTAFLQRHAGADAGACGGCDGCGGHGGASKTSTSAKSVSSVSPTLPSAPQPIVFHRRMPR